MAGTSPAPAAPRAGWGRAGAAASFARYSTRDQAYDVDYEDTNRSRCRCDADGGAAGCGAGILGTAEGRDRTRHQGLPREAPEGPPAGDLAARQASSRHR